MQNSQYILLSYLMKFTLSILLVEISYFYIQIRIMYNSFNVRINSVNEQRYKIPINENGLK